MRLPFKNFEILAVHAKYMLAYLVSLNLHRHLNALTSNDESILSNSNGVPGFPPKKATYSCIQMNGKEVFRFAVRCVPQSIEKALEEAGLPASSIDWLLLHQVSVLTKNLLYMKHCCSK